MVSTATKRGRLIKQGYGDNPDAWGPELNNGAIELGDAMWGTTEVAVSANVTLTVENYIADQARGFVLIFTGAGGFTVTHPTVDKPYYLVNNCTNDVTMKPQGGTGATVRAGTSTFYYTNSAGTVGNVLDPTLDKLRAPAANFSAGGFKLTNVATPTVATDAATKGYIDTLAASGSLAAVAAIAPQVVAVAAIDDEVVNVSGISAQVSNVSTNMSYVITVANNMTAVQNAAAIVGDFKSSAYAYALAFGGR